MRILVRTIPLLFVFPGILACAPAKLPVDPPLSEKVSKQIRRKVETGSERTEISCRMEILCGSAIIPAFYRNRGYAPAWSGRERLLPAADVLVAAIREAGREGLTPADYHLSAIQELRTLLEEDHSRGAAPDPEGWADLDLLLTDAFLLYGSHRLAGRVDPETLHADWVAYSPVTDLGALLQSSLETHRLQSALEGLGPLHPGYAALRAALLRYRTLASKGGWRPVPPGPLLRAGDRDERVDLLRGRLLATEDLPDAAAEDPLLVDEALDAAIRRFQNRHGLDPDGLVGPETLAALNLPAERRVRQIELNLERWRWVPRELGDRHILVNVPDYTLRFLDASGTVLATRIIVGKDYTATPVFSGMLQYLELNPSWNIPDSIATGELLPRIRTDPGYFARQKIRVYRSWRRDEPEIDPATIDWTGVNEEAFPFRLRQEPGPQNPLGRVKFIFPNRFAVYLHDTPARELFRRTDRDFSHGCIRVEEPLELAARLIGGEIGEVRKTLSDSVESGETVPLPLREPVPVHLLYFTAWVDENGIVQFRRDLYGRDPLLETALDERPPAVAET